MEDFRAKTGPLLASLDAPAVEPIRVARSGR